MRRLTRVPVWVFVFGIFANLAEFERNLIRERTRAGLAVARARGRWGGRLKKPTEDQVKFMRTLYDSREHPIVEHCKQFNIGYGTFYRYRNKWLKARTTPARDSENLRCAS